MSLKYIDGGVLAMPAKIDERFVYLPLDFVVPDAELTSKERMR